MNVGQGDAVLVVNRDLAKVAAAITAKGGTLPVNPIDYVPFAVSKNVPLAGTVRNALLIDGGDDEYGGNVVDYLETHGVVVPGTEWSPLLSVAVSHFHDDHMAGLRSVFRKVNPAKPPVPVLVERYRPATVYIPYTDSKAAPVSLRYQWFLDDLTKASTGVSPAAKVVRVAPGGLDPQTGQPIVIDLGQAAGGIPVRVHAVAAAQGVYNAGQVVRIPSKTAITDQNDRSIVFVVEYGSFRCFLGGDIAGNGLAAGGNVGNNAANVNAKAFFSSQHADVETTLRPAMAANFPKTAKRTAGKAKYPSAGYCTVMKANHHGSSSSMDVNLLATLRPLVLIISSGVKARFHNHPTQQVMNRVLAAKTGQWFASGSSGPQSPNSIDGIYVTEVAAKYKGAAFTTNIGTAKILGDIVVRPLDETVLAVQAASGTAADPLTVQVYGTGDQTTLADPKTTLRPTPGAAAGTYPIGPFLHTDQH